LAVAAVVAFNVNLNMQENSLSDLSLANVEALANDENIENKCRGSSVSGGPGASSCSISQEYPGGLASSKSVSCQDGYYACCIKDGWGNLSAHCIKN
jgi:hypothetical protein